MIAQGNGERGGVGEKAKRTAPSLPFAFGKRGRGGGHRRAGGDGFSRWLFFFLVFFLELVSSFPPAPQLSCYLPHNLLLLLFIVYLLNEGGGEGWGLTDSDKPSRSGWRAGGCGRPRGAAPGWAGLRRAAARGIPLGIARRPARRWLPAPGVEGPRDIL